MSEYMEHTEQIETIDPDDRELARFIGDSMTEAEREQFIERALEDDDLWDKLAPIVQLYSDPPRTLERRYREAFEPAELKREVRRRRVKGATVSGLVCALAVALTPILRPFAMRLYTGYSEARQHRAPTSDLVTTQRVETSANARTAVRLVDGIEVYVDSVSRFTYGELRQVVDMGGSLPAGALDGDATFVVPPTAGAVMVETRVGLVTIMPGRVRIHAPPGVGPVRIRVDSGMAFVIDRWMHAPADTVVVPRR